MKNKTKWRSLWIAAAAALLLAASPAAGQEAAETSSFVMPTGDLAIRKPSQPMSLLSGSDVQELDAQMASYQGVKESLLINNANHFYYYDNLDPVAKEIYDVMYQVAQDPGREGNIGFIMSDLDPDRDE